MDLFRAVRCPCGRCSDWHVEPNAAIQGVSFDEEQARIVADALSRLELQRRGELDDVELVDLNLEESGVLCNVLTQMIEVVRHSTVTLGSSIVARDVAEKIGARYAALQAKLARVNDRLMERRRGR